MKWSKKISTSKEVIKLLKAMEQIEDIIDGIDPGAIIRYRIEKFKQGVDKL